MTVGLLSTGLSDRRAVDGSVLRVVGASIGLAVGVEVRSALHRSAGAAAGLRVDGSVLRVAVTSIGLAVGNGVAVGIELRSALP